MRALAPVAALLVLSAGVVSAQSLAEVAKKEKDRRARAAGDESDGSVPVIGDEELKNARGNGVSVTGREPDPAAPSPSGDDAAEEPEERLSEAEVRKLRETWARIWPERLRAAETELRLAEDAVFQCQSAAHYVFVPIAVDCNGVFERRAIAEYRVKELRENRYNWELLLPERQRPPPPE